MKQDVKKSAPRETEWTPVGNFARRVAFTTALAFTLLSFFYLLISAFVTVDNAKFSFFITVRYILGKELCIFLFSLCLGFANRIPEQKGKSRSLLRFFRFLAALASFGVTMILMFYGLFDPGSLSVRGALLNLVLFLALYFITLGVTALLRKIFGKKDDSAYKSILD